MRHGSRGVFYFVAAVSVGLLVALLVGWNLLLIENYLLAVRIEAGEFHWIILSVGCVFFIVVMVTIVMLVRYLVRFRERHTFQQVLLDSVTHELKSPLASMRLLMETLARRELPLEKEQELRRMVIEDLERLNHLIDHMLEAGRVEQHRRAFDFQTVRLEDVVARTVDGVRRRRGEAFTLEVDMSQCPETFDTDPLALEIILFNLVDNAVKYSTDATEVALTLTTDDAGRLVASVSDRGLGLDRRDLRRVFRRFYRARPKRSEDNQGGVGLGLFVVAGLVARLGGGVWAESEGFGRGSTFHLEIPPHPALGGTASRRSAA